MSGQTSLLAVNSSIIVVTLNSFFSYVNILRLAANFFSDKIFSFLLLSPFLKSCSESL